jgi:murein DD-endopeptidase MepM/ murein hydrolase activator NlpD
MRPNTVLTGLLLFCVLSVVPLVPIAHAETIAELQAKIEAQNKKIQEVEAEIKKFEAELTVIGANKNTLQNEIKRLDTVRKKLSADINATTNRIEASNLKLTELGSAIDITNTRISRSMSGVGEALRSLSHAGDTTLIEQYFGADDISEVWMDMDMLATFSLQIGEYANVLTAAKQELQTHKQSVETEKNKLTNYKYEIAQQKVVLDNNRKEQDTILSETKNKESEYQKLLATKRAAKLDFERELNSYESALKFTLDPAAIPSPGAGVLGWPMESAYMAKCAERKATFSNIYCITQYFGDTPFAKSGAYNGKGHNGIDFGVADGTKIVASLSGVVEATGNTDQYRGCYSYGKWVLVKHGNGLSTLYAHLSVISVSAGDAVAAGGLIGFSGRTGYATGPHLHFTVYASDAVKLMRLGDIKIKTGCAAATVPVSATTGYLNPLDYF